MKEDAWKWQKKDTICWECGNACTKGCSWAAKGKPVRGWTAEKSYIKSGWGEKIDSYLVIACPKYRPYEKLKAKDLSGEGMVRLMETCIELAQKDYILGKEEERSKIREFFRDIAPERSGMIIKELNLKAEKHDDMVATKRFKVEHAADLAAMHPYWIHLFVVEAYRDFAEVG